MKPHGRYFRLVLFVYQDFEKKNRNLPFFFLNYDFCHHQQWRLKITHNGGSVALKELVGEEGGHSLTRNEVSGKLRHRDEV